MPQIIPFVVTAITAVTSAVVAAGPLAVAAFNAANIIGAGLLANEAFKAVQPQVKSSSTAIEWNADPNAPNRFAFGRVGGAGNIIHNATYGPDKMFVGFVGVMSASGPIKSWQAFKADDSYVSFNASGMAINTDYANEMYLGRQRGLQPEPSYLPSPSGLKNGAAMPRWGSSYKLSGKAAYHYTLAENSKRSAFKGKVPTGIHIIEGLFCYDPRFDSTYPGGAGPCRLDDPTTWVYSTNAYIHGLSWNIGRWEGLASGYNPARYGVPYASIKVGGIGARPEGIDFAAYVEAANVFDENGWACAAWPDADQGKGAVLDSFLQAGGGIYAERQGKVSCLHRAAPRASIVTITADDTAGTIEYDTTTSLLERINTIRPEYWSEAHGWQMVATDEVTSTVWRNEDGQGVEVTKSKGLAYNYVPGSKQARELAALQIAHTREGIRGTAPIRHYLDLDVGDCFTFEVPEAVLNGQKCIVLNVDPDLENDIIHVTFASETDAKYPFAYGQTNAPPPAPGLQPASIQVSPPSPGDWVLIPRLPGEDGVQVPIIDIIGEVGNATATAMRVEWGFEPDPPPPDPIPTAPEGERQPVWADWVDWRSAGTFDVTTKQVALEGAPPGGSVYVALSYQRGQNWSEREVKGPVLVPGLVAGGVTPDARETIVQEVIEQVDHNLNLAIKGGQEALDRARELGLSLIAAAASNLDGILSEERIRNTEITDALDRMSLFGLADPILRTGILRREVILEGMGPSGDETFVQMETRLVAADSVLSLGVAQVLIDAKAYTSSQISAAFAVLASKAEMAAAISASELSLRAYADNTVATATAGLVTVSRLNAAIADSRLALETWTNGQISTATAGLMTASQVDGKIAASELAMKSYADGKVATATAGLATVVQVDNKIAAAELTLKSYADDKVAQGTVGLATKAELGSAIGASELSLKTYTDGKVATAVSGLISAVEVDNKIAAASLTLSGQIDSKIATATANLVTVSQMNGALAGAELTLKSYADQAVVTGTANLAAKSDVLVRGNILPNSTGADGATGWALGGAWQSLTTGAGGPRFESAGTFTSATTSDPIAGIIPGDILTLSADFRRQMAGGSVAADVIWLNASGGQISISARIFVSANRDYGERLSIQLTAPANTAQCRVRFFVENPVENLGSGIRRIKLERGVSPATPWIDSAADMRLWSLVGIQGETLINVNDRLEQASLRLVAAASGGNPAIVELYSSSAGDSNIRLRARQIQFGENTVLDTTTGLQVSVFGTTRRVVAQGAAFGAAPDAGQLTEWEGANSVPLDGMTRANAYYFRANTEPRHGGSAVNGSVPFKVISTHRSIGATRSGIGTVTTPLVTFSAQGAIGPVSFDVYFVDGDNSITATNPSSDDADAPFEHQTAFRTSLTQLGQQKTARMVCAVRDSVGNTGSAYLGIGLTELS